MQLLTFAHKNEAYSFFKNIEFKSVDFYFDGVFKSDNYYLLVTGEGCDSTAEKLNSFLGAFHHTTPINRIINFGIAGALSALELHKIYPIRTIYGEKSKSSMKFKSYATANNIGHDLVSSLDRVFENSYANKLSAFGDIVDREAYAIASSAKLFSIPLFCYKLISDFAGNSTDCLQVKNDFMLYSDQLYSYFYENCQSFGATSVPQPIANPLPDDFYLTHTQGHQVNQLFEKIKNKNKFNNAQVLELLPLEKIRTITDHPKKKTSLLILEMQNLLNPLNTSFNSALNEKVKTLKEQNIKVRFSEHFESSDIQFQFNSHSADEFNKKTELLKQFPFDDVTRILEGEF